MKFKILDKQLRKFETLNDQYILPEMFAIARLDGRSFTKLTKETVPTFDKPFDSLFNNIMTQTVVYLMECGFNIVYGYTQSDEISLLIHPNEDSFNRKIRKYNSILAGEASAKFTNTLGKIGVFDCRISQFPNIPLVIDYFRWRAEDALRNSLNSYCYWTLRENGKSARSAANILKNKTVSEKNELLFDYGINFNDVEAWHKRGTGVYWEWYEKDGYNPHENISVTVSKRRLKKDRKLPVKSEYSEFLTNLINDAIEV